jgi:hypothetical protein
LRSAIHFISGLPRAGSTLLSAILRQNPRFQAGMTGPVGSLVEAMLRGMSAQIRARFIPARPGPQSEQGEGRVG